MFVKLRPFSLVDLIAVTGGGLSLWLFVDRAADSAEEIARTAIWMLFSLVVVTAILLVVQEIRFARKRRYAEALTSIRSAVYAINERQVVDAEVALAVLGKLAEYTSQAFTIVTGRHVGVCIRTVGATVDPIGTRRDYAEDVCRDLRSVERGQSVRYRRLKRQDSPDLTHYVDESTAYSYLSESFGTPGMDFYLCNNLAMEKGYRSASFKRFGQPRSSRFLLYNEYLRSTTWPLPYRSTLILALGSLSNTEPQTQVHVGFLCLDSESTGPFYKRYDKELLRVMGRAIGPILGTYIDLLGKERRDYQYSMLLLSPAPAPR